MVTLPQKDLRKLKIITFENDNCLLNFVQICV